MTRPAPLSHKGPIAAAPACVPRLVKSVPIDRPFAGPDVAATVRSSGDATRPQVGREHLAKTGDGEELGPYFVVGDASDGVATDAGVSGYAAGVAPREGGLKLRNGNRGDRLVQMLGERLDHPPRSVAASFRPYLSLSPYIQFIGRAMGVNAERSPSYPDNRGVVVTRVGPNIDRYWDDFKQIDADDQEFIRGWLEADDVRPPERGESEGSRPLIDNGASLPEVQRLLGHADLSTTQAYVGATGKGLEAAPLANPARRLLRS